MSRAEELVEEFDYWAGNDAERWQLFEKAAAELRRLSAVEAELAECKAAYESQFKELHALKATLAASCADEREQLWEATPGGGCSRALDAERELEALKKAIREAEPKGYLIRKAENPDTKGWFIPANLVAMYQRDSLTREPLYTLKGIK